MTNISSNESWGSKTHLGIKVGAIHVDLPTMFMNDITDILNLGFEDTMC
jgi:hypothetical protein